MARRTSRTISREENNIIYVEPNYSYSTEMYGENGLNTYEFIPPTEDYSIYLNLKVETRGRTIRTNATSDKNELVLSWETDVSGRTTTNLMEGTRIHVGNKGGYINSLTTSYTDIFIGDWKKKPRATIEMFGINSVDIAYNSYMVPEVTIQFTDIRGASVFGPKEAYETALNDAGTAAKDGNVDVANTFFQCFFTFPYPKFTLLVKGFYGQPVSYELTCSDFRARFNSESGNFDCTAKFIGYHFSFLADVMFNILAAAPYSDYIGSEFWEQSNFKFVNSKGEEIAAKMPKMIDAVRLFKHVEKLIERENATEPEVQEAMIAQENINNSGKVHAAYNSYISSLTDKIKDKTIEDSNLKLYFEDVNEQGTPKTFVLFTRNGNEKRLADYLDCLLTTSTLYEALRVSIDEYNESNAHMKIAKLDELNFENLEGKEFLANISLKISENANDNSKAYVDWEALNVSLPSSLKEQIDNNVEQGNAAEGINPYLSYRNGYVFTCKAADDIDKILASNAKTEDETQKSLLKKRKKLLEKLLGWKPSVENITRMVMAHFVTLAYMIFKTGYEIASENPRRTLASLGINDADDLSDVPDSQKNTYVPPFPKVTKKTTHEGDVVREETWVGDYRGSGFLEKELVHGLINGVNTVAEKLDMENTDGITVEEYSGQSLVQMTSTGAVTTVMPFPICTLDLIAEKDIYSENGHNQNDVPSLLGLIALRAINAFYVSRDIYGHNYSSEKAELLGKLEWVNYLKANGGTLSAEMNQKLSAVKQNIDSIMEMLNGNESDVIEKGESGKWPWECDNTTKAMITNGVFSLYDKKAGTTTFPYEGLGWSKLNIETFESDIALHSESYINTNYGEKKKNVFTVETNIDRFVSIAQNQFTGITEENSSADIVELKETLISAATFSSFEYKKKCTNESELRKHLAFIIDRAEKILPSENSGMLPTSCSAAKALAEAEANLGTGEKTIGRGYNADYFSLDNPGEGGQGLFVNDWHYGTDKDDKVVRKKAPNGEKAFDFYMIHLNDYEMTLVEFPGLNNDGTPMRGSEKVTLFCQLMYYIQKSDYAKAMLFLCSLGAFFNYKSIAEEYVSKTDKPMFIIPLPAVMFFGGLLWCYDTDNLTKVSLKGYSGVYDILKDLNQDVQDRLVETFKHWVTDGVDGNSYLTSFNEFASKLELKVKEESNFYERQLHGKLSIINFFLHLDELEDGKSWIEDSNYRSCLELLAFTFTDDFFRNYIAVDEDHYGDYDNATKGFRALNRDGGPAIIDAVNFSLAGCVFIKNTNFFHDGRSNIPLFNNASVIKSFFKGFLNDVKEGEEPKDLELISKASEPENTSDDIKVGIYRYCKLLYDKWLGGLSMEEFEHEWSMERLFENDNKYFHFIDAYYNLAGYLSINAGHFADLIVSCFNTDSQYHLLSFLSEIYSHNKFSFLCVQNFIDLSEPENMKSMFDLVPYTEVWNVKENPNFIVMYPYEASSHLEIELGQYEDDSFMINDTFNKHKWPEPLKSRNADVTKGYRIPAFGVSFGKMYQSYFKDIEVGMDNPVVTEQSIKAQYEIACQERPKSDGKSKIYTYGQDLYAIYSNNSYTCNVTMMGCAWVQPLMYFVLNNVPMFRGTYLIEKVSHHLEPGNMVTKFMGVRMANVSTRIIEEEYVTSEPRQNGEGSGSENNMVREMANKYADIDNNCPYKVYPLTEDDLIINGGQYGEPDYSSYFDKPMGQIKGFSLGNSSYWYDKPFLDSITSVLCAESDGTPLGIMLVAATMYNRMKSKNGGLDIVAHPTHYSVWKNGNAEKAYENHPQNWDTMRSYAEKIFSYGACACMVGKSFTIPTSWNLYRNGNNDLYNLETGKEYHLKPEQVSQMAVYGFKEEWDNTYSSSPNCIRKKECKLLAVLGTNTPQAVCSEYSVSSKSKVKGDAIVEAPKGEENGDRHVENLTMNFLAAVDKTCANTYSNVKVGYDPNKSNNDSIYIIPADKAETNFSKVFDVILNGYGSKVSEIKWVANSNGDLKSEPVAYLATVKESSNTTKISVVYENNLNSNLDIPLSSDANGNTMNVNFCKALRKKYNSRNLEDTPENAAIIANAARMVAIDTNNALSEGEAKEILVGSSYKLKDCNTVLSDNGYDTQDMSYTLNTNADLNGYSGEVNNEKMKKVLRYINDFCVRHQYDITSSWYNVKNVQGGRFNGVTGGMCTYSVSTWYAYSDVDDGQTPIPNSKHDLHFWSSPKTSTFNEIKAQMNRYGFKLVWHGTIEESKELDKSPSINYRPGDLSTQHYYKTNGQPSSHACMWTGHDWRSDFYQGGQMVAGKHFKDRQDNYSMCIWRNPEYQEEGKDVIEVS